MPLNPPICLEVLFQNITAQPNPNEYAVLFTTNGQTYNNVINAANAYYLTNVTVGMWCGNSSYGYAFRIKSLSNVTPNTCNAIIEDVDGFNALIDPNGDGGGPSNNTKGYIFDDFSLCAKLGLKKE